MKKKLKKDVGERLRQFRKKIGYTQDRIAPYMGVGRANYSRIEIGDIFPGIPALVTLKDEFNLSLHWLLCNHGEMFIEEKEKPDNHVFLGEDNEDIKDLLHHILNVPMVKHSVLSFFLEYKMKNKTLIDKVFAPEPE